ncbi:hypothetical protein GQ457_13G019250 [Hibiscus cannabinus]
MGSTQYWWCFHSRTAFLKRRQLHFDDKLSSLFGSKIVVFTGGDGFADVDQTFEDHLSPALEVFQLIALCNRLVRLSVANHKRILLKKQEETSHEEQLRRITEMLEATRSEQQLACRKAELAQEIPSDEFLKMLEEDIPVDKILLIPHLTNCNLSGNSFG